MTTPRSNIRRPNLDAAQNVLRTFAIVPTLSEAPCVDGFCRRSERASHDPLKHPCTPAMRIDMLSAKIRCSRAVSSFEWVGDHVLYVTVAGELTDDCSRMLRSRLDALLSGPRKPITIFWDLSGLRGWEPSSRRETMMLLARHRGRIAEQHMLAASPAIRVDVRVVAVVLGKVSCYYERALFDMAVDAVTGAQYRECG